MDKNSFPIFPLHQGFPIEPLFVKGEVEDVGEKIDQVLFEEENPEPLPLQILGPVSKERFYQLIGVQNFGMGIGDHKGRLNRIEKQLSSFQNFNHNRPPFDSFEGLTIWEGPRHKDPLGKEAKRFYFILPSSKVKVNAS
jgi:hypothetical protein